MSEQSSKRPRTIAEWVTLGVVVLILAVLVGILTWYAVQPAREAAFRVTIETESIAEREGRFYVPLRILNTGGMTAEDIVVRAEVLRDGEALEEAEATITVLSGGEEAEAVAIFQDDPRSGTIEAGVTSYVIP